jgi:hypothetical protein
MREARPKDDPSYYSVCRQQKAYDRQTLNRSAYIDILNRNKLKLNKIHIIHPDTFSYRESVLKGDNVFAAMVHLAEGLCLSSLLTLKVENFICFVVIMVMIIIRRRMHE